MKTILGVAQMAETTVPTSVVTIGNFDGVHLGHRRLIEQLVRRARQHSIPAVVFTFNPHPVQILHPDRKLARLFDLNDQEEQLRQLGVDFLIVEPFSKKFSQLIAEDFLREWILLPFNPKILVVGHDFTFGAARQGTIDFLRRQCTADGVSVEVVPPVSIGGQMVSSSRVRQAIAAGDVETATKLLGRPFFVRGPVVEGYQRGRQIGVPTANIKPLGETWPLQGVYATKAYVNGQCWSAVTNIGVSPTFEDGVPAPRIESHLFGFSQEIYGSEIKLEFIRRIRDEKKFSSVEELKKQIQNDIKVAEEFFNASMEQC